MENFNTYEVYVKEKENRITDHFWTHDPSILYDPDRIIEFFPTKDMTTNEKLNALSRFFIYLGILLFIVVRNYNLLFIPIIAVSIIYLIHYNDTLAHVFNLEQFDEKIKQDLGIKLDTPLKIDSVGDICQMPTPNNPFMNILITDYTDNPQRPPACSQAEDDVKAETEKYFNYNLYKDVEDIWDKRNSQRQYVTMPWTTIPNDRDSFMKWCWKTTNVCKDGDQDYCLEFEDLRLPGYS